MGDKIFSVDYYPAAQRKFELAIQTGDLNEAYRILDNMLPAHSEADQLRRLAVLAQGYRALSDRALKVRTRLSEADEELTRAKSRAEDLERQVHEYSELGSVEKLREALGLIGEYGNIGTPERIAGLVDLSRAAESVLTI